MSCIHVKISQLVASLQTSRQQVVFALLVTSCQQVWNKLLTTCNNLVDIVRLVTRLFQQGCYNHDITIFRAGARTLIGGGGGVYSYIRVMPD